MTGIVLWVALGFISLAVVLMVAGPLLRAGIRLSGDRRASYDVAVFRDQLAEVDRDQDAGRMNPDEAVAAKAEIERRMLRALDGRAAGGLDGSDAGDAKPIAAALPLALGVVTAAAAIALYLHLGEPGAADAPLAGRADAPAAGRNVAAGGRQAIANLKQRVAANPADIRARVGLARAEVALGQHAEAVRNYERALELAGQDASAELIGEYGEALTLEAFGTVSPRAVAIFEKALAADPTDIKARYYIAAARAQAGDYRGAIALWRGLTADAPEDAPWLPTVREQISQAAMRGEIVPMQVEPERPAEGRVGGSGAGGAIAGDAQPSAADVKAAREMSPEDQQAFIRAMVARLAEKMEASPDDVNGWMRLGRAYKVLGETDAATHAFGRARTRLEDVLANTPADAPTRAGVEATLREVEELMRP